MDASCRALCSVVDDEQRKEMVNSARLVQAAIFVVLGTATIYIVMSSRKESAADKSLRRSGPVTADSSPGDTARVGSPSISSASSASSASESNSAELTREGGDDNPFMKAARQANAGHEPWVTPAGAVNRIAAEITDALADGPVNAIWIFDLTESAENLRNDAVRELTNVLPKLAGAPAARHRSSAPTASGDSSGIDAGNSRPSRLQFGVCGYAGKLHLGVGKLTNDLTAILAELKRLGTDASGTEMTFTALRESIDRLVMSNSEAKRQTIVTIVTDEIGDDADQVDAAIEMAKRHAVTVYVIGPSTSFGRDDTLGVGRDTENLQPVRRGPETVAQELLELDDTEITGDLYKFDSGFGPYALSRLCHASGGQYLRVDPHLQSTKLFPIEGIRRLDTAAMNRYKPEYLSKAEYQKLLASNAACKALVEATRQPPIPIRQELKLEFAKSGEAELKRALDEAQRAVARIEPKLRQLWTTLTAGKADRDKMPSARWKASYDLAVGRLLATRCRVEGYNIACAQLKQGRVQGAAERRTWVLAPSDEGLGDSSLEKLIKDARAQLERIQHEHPDTPWALMAQRELKAPLGWKWQDR